MKIAIYLSGQPRYLDKEWVWNSITRLFNGHYVDFYFHFWEDQTFTKEYILNRIKPKQYVFDLQKDFTKEAKQIVSQYPTDNLPIKSCFNMMSFYYSFAQARNIVPLEKYDFILKTRTDIGFDNPLNHFVSETENKLLIDDSCWKKPHRRLSDLCFFGKPGVFSKVLTVAENATQPQTYMDDYDCVTGGKLTSHRYLGYAFKKFNVEYAAVPMGIMLIRHFTKGSGFGDFARDCIKYGDEVHVQMLLRNFPTKRAWISKEIKNSGRNLKDKTLLVQV